MELIKGEFSLKKENFELSVQFSWPGAGVIALLGASASGKTSLLRCIAGLEAAAQGKLSVNGVCWQDHTTKHFLPTEKRGIGYVFQEASLFPHLSVKNNLAYGLKRTPVAQQRLQLDQVVELLDLSTLLARGTYGLSGGERQRIALARALLSSPALLLMDEPLAGLDVDRKAEILPYLKKLHHNLAIPMIYVSHQPDETAQLASHIVHMKKGQIIREGSPKDLLPPESFSSAYASLF